MNKLLATTAALAAFAAVGTASAADLPMKAPPMVVAAPVASWTGCWVSGGIGYGMWNQDHYITNPAFTPTTTVTTTDGGRGWLGRGGVGCDYQISPSFVIGAFGDYDWMGLNGSNSPSEVIAGPGGAIQPVTGNMKETGSWAAGARLGYLPYPNLMTYVSGGWTQARFTNSGEFTTLTGTTIGFNYPNYTANGWFLGGGTEYRVPWGGFNGLFWRTEYRYSSYQNANLTEVATATGVPTGNVETMKANVQTVTTSLVWKFNWGGPVVARY
jgi:outer membrane immunogenic protein